MKSLSLRTILFTLEDKDISKNSYVSIFIIWLTSVIKQGKLTQDDQIVLTTDHRTYQYLQDDSLFPRLQQSCICSIVVKLRSSPKTLLEGMMWKYIPYTFTQEVLMYCDIDILIVNSLHSIVDSLHSNSLVLQIEGPITDLNYGAAFTKDELQKFHPQTPGFSAGKFMIVGNNLQYELFEKIQALHNYDCTIEYFTIEQPLFNRTIHEMIDGHFYLDTTTLDIPVISTNGEDFDKSQTVLLDCMGDPGNGVSHFSRILDALCLLHANLI